MWVAPLWTPLCGAVPCGLTLWVAPLVWVAPLLCGAPLCAGRSPVGRSLLGPSPLMCSSFPRRHLLAGWLTFLRSLPRLCDLFLLLQVQLCGVRLEPAEVLVDMWIGRWVGSWVSSYN